MSPEEVRAGHVKSDPVVYGRSTDFVRQFRSEALIRVQVEDPVPGGLGAGLISDHVEIASRGRQRGLILKTLFLLFARITDTTIEIKAINNELELVNNVLLDNIHDLVVVIERTGKINLLNKALKDLFSSNYKQTLSPGDSILTFKNAFSTRITSFLQVH